MAATERVFLDTNVLVYQFDQAAPAKQAQAIELIKRCLAEERGFISSQVVQEFLNVALRKFSHQIPPSDVQQVMDDLLGPLCAHFPTFDYYERALRLFSTDSLSFYDALIIQAAIDLGCRTLYSEDLQDGRRIGAMAIKNPFA
jgi:predicted nucleic acid-binding protein